MRFFWCCAPWTLDSPCHFPHPRQPFTPFHPPPSLLSSQRYRTGAYLPPLDLQTPALRFLVSVLTFSCVSPPPVDSSLGGVMPSHSHGACRVGPTFGSTPPPYASFFLDWFAILPGTEGIDPLLRLLGLVCRLAPKHSYPRPFV